MATIIEKYGTKMHHSNTFCNQPCTIFVLVFFFLLLFKHKTMFAACTLHAFMYSDRRNTMRVVELQSILLLEQLFFKHLSQKKRRRRR